MPRARRKTAPRKKRISKLSSRFLTIGKLMPSVLRLKLNYTQMVATSSTITPSAHVFRGNSLYDPDYTGVGHQPLGFDQIAALYNRFLVVGVDAAVSSTTDSGSAMICLINTTGSFAPPTTIATAIEQQGSLFKIIQNGTSQVFMRKHYSTSKSMGLTHLSTSDIGYDCTASANPTYEYPIILLTQHVDESTAVTVRHLVKLTYHVIAFERKKLASS